MITSDFFGRNLSIMNWSDFLCELSLLILLNRSNDNVIINQTRRASIPPHLSNVSAVSRRSSPSIEIDLPSRMILSRTSTPSTNVSCDDLFRKHEKILEKLNRQ